MFSQAMGLFKLFWGAEPKGAGCEGFGGRGAGGPGKGQVQSPAWPAGGLLAGWWLGWLFAQRSPLRKFVSRLICLLFTLAQRAAPWGGLGRGIACTQSPPASRE